MTRRVKSQSNLKFRKIATTALIYQIAMIRLKAALLRISKAGALPVGLLCLLILVETLWAA